MIKDVFRPSFLFAAAISSVALGHAGPRIYLDIQNGKVVTYDGPYPPPEDTNGNVSTNPADYYNYSISHVFPGAPPDETSTNGQPDANVLPLHWDDDPLNFSTEFPGLQVYNPGSVAAGTPFSYNIMGQVQWYNTTTETFEPISTAFPTSTPFIAVTNDLGNSSFSSTGFVPGNLAFTYDGDPTDHEHLTFTICTPEDLADGFDPEDAPAGVYALPLQLTSSAATTPSDTFYILFGDRGPNLSVSQTAMQNEMQQAIGVANTTLGAPPKFTWNNAGGGGDGITWDKSQQNWNDGVATYTDGAQVLFNDGNNGNYAVTLNGIVSPGSVAFSNAAGNYSLSGSGSITGPGSLTKNGPGSLTLGTTNNYTGGTTVISGTVVAGVSNAIPANSSLTIDPEGAVQLAANTGLATLSGLNLAPGAVLDIENNHVIINYGSGLDPISSVGAWIADGAYGTGTTVIWSGIGITSSAAQDNPAYGIGYADSADPGNPAGLSSGQIEIMYTLLGDANLDGKVNGTDFNLMATNFNQAVTDGWDEGDFNYDGKVNGNDFVLLAANFNQFAGQSAVSSADAAALDSFAIANGISLANVPEPFSPTLIAFSSFTLLGGRKRRSVGREINLNSAK